MNKYYIKIVNTYVIPKYLGIQETYYCGKCRTKHSKMEHCIAYSTIYGAEQAVQKLKSIKHQNYTSEYTIIAK